jgi:hypothetical protein
LTIVPETFARMPASSRSRSAANWSPAVAAAR